MSGHTIELPETLTIKTVTEVKAKFEHALEDKPDTCRVDCHQVSRVDALGVQLLLVIRNTMARSDGHMLLHNAPEQMITALATLGLLAEFEFEG